MSFSFDVNDRELAEADWMLEANGEFAHKIREGLKRKKMSQSDLANCLGKEPSVISRELSGRANLTLRTIGALCWALDIKPRLSLEPIEHNEKPSNAPPPASIPTTSTMTMSGSCWQVPKACGNKSFGPISSARFPDMVEARDG